MLIKLYKHEMKTMALRFLPITLLMLVLAIPNRFLLGAIDGSYMDGFFWEVFIPIFETVFFIFVACFVVITLVFCIQRFQKHIFGDEGYLTMTLPVPSWQIVLVKAMVAGFWTLVNGVITMVVIIISIPDSYFLDEVLKMLRRVIPEISEFFQVPQPVVVLEILFFCLVIVPASYCIMYAAISFGQNFRRFRIAGALAIYFVILIGTQSITSAVISRYAETFVETATYHDMMLQMGPMVHSIMIMSALLTLAFSLCGFFYTMYHLKHRLNME